MYAIIGASGFLGSYLIQSILNNTADNIIAAARNTDGLPADERILPVKCDITSVNDVNVLAGIIRQGEPCKLIYTAAYHNLDLIAQNPKTSWNINITALASFLNTIDNLTCFFFTSTDCVYGEGISDYSFKETDSLKPISLYGIQKVAAECLVNACGHNVLRLPYMFGPSLSPQKFHFFDKIVEELRQGKEVKMFYDSVRSALDYGTVASLIVQLAENYSSGKVPTVLNLCGDDNLSKYDLGIMLSRSYCLSEDLIVSTSMENDNQIFQAKRASVCLMDNTLLKNALSLTKISIAL